MHLSCNNKLLTTFRGILLHKASFEEALCSLHFFICDTERTPNSVLSALCFGPVDGRPSQKCRKNSCGVDTEHRELSVAVVTS